MKRNTFALGIILNQNVMSLADKSFHCITFISILMIYWRVVRTEQSDCLQSQTCIKKAAFLVWKKLHFWFGKSCIFGLQKAAFLVWKKLHFWFEKSCIFGSEKAAFLDRKKLHFWFAKSCIFGTEKAAFLDR